jgi:acyl-CoA synthetase (AMP-forming)/AMP-acid ligase II
MPFSVLRERAGLQPVDIAFMFTDFDKDWTGVPEGLTWWQVHRRSLTVAHGLDEQLIRFDA